MAELICLSVICSSVVLFSVLFSLSYANTVFRDWFFVKYLKAFFYRIRIFTYPNNNHYKFYIYYDVRFKYCIVIQTIRNFYNANIIRSIFIHIFSFFRRNVFAFLEIQKKEILNSNFVGKRTGDKQANDQIALCFL